MRVAVGTGSVSVGQDGRLDLHVDRAYHPAGMPSPRSTEARRLAVRRPLDEIAAWLRAESPADWPVGWGVAEHHGAKVVQGIVVATALPNGTNVIGVRTKPRGDDETSPSPHVPIRYRPWLRDLPSDGELGHLFVCDTRGRWREVDRPRTRLLGVLGTCLGQDSVDLGLVARLGYAALRHDPDAQMDELREAGPRWGWLRSARRLGPFLAVTRANGRAGRLDYLRGLAVAAGARHPTRDALGGEVAGLVSMGWGGHLVGAGEPVLGAISLAGGLVGVGGSWIVASGVPDYRRQQRPLGLPPTLSEPPGSTMLVRRSGLPSPAGPPR